MQSYRHRPSLKAAWDIPEAKFTSQKVARVFAGIQKN
jgi:hypothetical protein